MTVPLSPDSPRKRAAVRFGALLVETMAARGVGKKGLARQLATSGGLIWQWSAGNNLPRLETALRLAEALGEPRLADIVREARTVNCEVCGTPILNEGGTPVRFCTESCREVRRKLRVGAEPARVRAVGAERRLALYQDAVATMCRGCEPEGLCRDAECALRPVSPLRMARKPAPTVVTVAPDPPRVLSESHRAAISRASSRRWARPGERERSSAAVRERLRSRTPEEVEQWKRRIGEGQRRRLAMSTPGTMPGSAGGSAFAGGTAPSGRMEGGA
jgi:predicted nucleic acid-binding Zn ribbon protein